MDAHPPPHVVIVGAGFAGLAAARALAGQPVTVTLLDPSDQHTFVPLLYQVAAGRLEPGDVAPRLADLLAGTANVAARRASLIGVQPDARLLTLDDGSELAYDALLVATGAVPVTSGVPGADEHALRLHDLHDATVLRDHLAAALASRPSDTIVVVGGGATGVEVAGAVADLSRQDGARPRVVLVEVADALLGRYRPTSQEHAVAALRARGVEVLLGMGVDAVGPAGLRLSDGRFVSSRTVIWAAGVRGDPLAARLGLPVGAGGRVEVGPDLRVPGWGEVFVAGDLALARDGDGVPYPQLAPVAIQAGEHAAAEILRRLRGAPPVPFRFRDLGTLAVVADGSAVADLPLGITLTGLPAWLLWLGVHVATLPGRPNQVRVVRRWAGALLGRPPVLAMPRSLPCPLPPFVRQARLRPVAA